MRPRRSFFQDPHFKPVAILAGCLVILTLADGGLGRVLSLATTYTALESFGTFGLVALGLGMTMMIREFDLSVVGMFSLAGCIAVLTGGLSPVLGVICAMTVGVLAGAAQGLLMVRLRLGSIGITLGGLLILAGVAYVLSENRSIPYENMGVALDMNRRFAGVFSIRSLLTVAIFIVAGLLIAATRIGRDIIAIGSNRRAAIIGGVNVDGLIIAIFAFSGATTALSGALLSYSLASAAPTGLTDVIVPAVAAAILGGVSLGGGTGRPMGIAVGVLALGMLRAGFNALGAPPFVNDISMGSILMLVAITDGAWSWRRLSQFRRWLSARN
jgi:ribose/xylose/arabinose/galactoside ABC-type transport system permease subunit